MERIELIKELRSFYENIISGLSNKNAAFGEYIQDPLSEIYDDDYYYYYQGLSNEEREQIGNKEPISFHKIFCSDFRVTLRSEFNGSFHSGAYRGCFLIDDGLGNDWVLKFNRRLSDCDEDCCDKECCFYEDAKACGVDCFFVETFSIGSFTINGEETCCFYVARRADVDIDYINESRSRSEDYEYDNDKYSDFEGYFDDEGAAVLFADFYVSDWDLLESLTKFLEDNCIFDLHEYNIGFYEGMPIIIDYASC